MIYNKTILNYKFSQKYNYEKMTKKKRSNV